MRSVTRAHETGERKRRKAEISDAIEGVMVAVALLGG
jgi:hypothetical protein